MGRAAAAASGPQHERRLPRSPGPAAARRVSGPVLEQRDRDQRPRLLSAPGPGTGLVGGVRAVAGGGASIAWRAASLALDVSASRAMDRLVRSRGWIVVVGFALIGIVAMQVSLLKLNAGIGRAVAGATTLERSNSTLRLDVSQLSATDRILRLATEKGFVMPAPVDVHYLRAGGLASDGRRAVENMRAPGPGANGLTPGAALPGTSPAGDAVAAAGVGAASPPRTTTAPPGAGPGSPTSVAPGAGPTGGGQSRPTAGTGTIGSGSPAPTSGGITPPSAPASTPNP